MLAMLEQSNIWIVAGTKQHPILFECFRKLGLFSEMIYKLFCYRKMKKKMNCRDFNTNIEKKSLIQDSFTSRYF